MEDRHLQKAMFQDPFIKALYGGIFPADGLLHNSSPRGFYIFNTDETGQPGSHWCVFYFNEENSEFFDSLGQPPSLIMLTLDTTL